MNREEDKYNQDLAITESSMQLGSNYSSPQPEIRNLSAANDLKKNKIKLFISKDKWIPDKDVKNCFNCGKTFIPLVRRKHHCRICGRIFCNKCSSKTLDRDEIGIDFHEKDIRVCDFCYKYCETYLKKLQSKESEPAPKYRDPFYDAGIFEEEDDNFMNRYEFCEEVLRSQNADEIRTKVLLKIDNLTVKVCEIQNIKDWIDNMQTFIKTAVQEVRVDTLRSSDCMDINYYIKIKKILWKDSSESRYIQGVACRKNVSNRKMNSSFLNPRVMIISPSIDIIGETEGDNLISFENLLNNEKKAIKKIVDKIMSLSPDVIFVEKSINRIAHDQLTAQGITLICKVKPQLLSRIARCTRSRIIKDLSKLSLDKEKNNRERILGNCKSFITRRYDTGHLPSKQSFSNSQERFHKKHAHHLSLSKGDHEIHSAGEGLNHKEGASHKASKLAPDPTLMFIEGCNPVFGVSLTVSGPDIEKLKIVKKSLKGLLSISRHLFLEAEIVIHDLKNFSILNKTISSSKCCEIQKPVQEADGEAVQVKCTSKEIFTQGNFQKFTDEKTSFEYLLKYDGIEYCLIILVKSNPSDYNDIGMNDSPNKEIDNLMVQNRLSPRWKMECFSDLCDFPQVRRKAFYSAKDDISLGKYILEKVNALFTQCETCKRPFYNHTPIYYYKNVYVKISKELTGFSKALAVSEENEVKKRKETNDNFLDLPASRIDASSPMVKASMVGESYRNQVTGEYTRSGKRENTYRKNSISKNLGIQTYIECNICKEQITETTDLNRNFLEYSFTRLLMNFFLNSFPDDMIVKPVERPSECCHVLKTRVFKYDEILVKFFSFSSNYYRNDVLDFRKVYIDKNNNNFEILSSRKKDDIFNKFHALIMRMISHLNGLKAREELEFQQPEPYIIKKIQTQTTKDYADPIKEEISEMQDSSTSPNDLNLTSENQNVLDAKLNIEFVFDEVEEQKKVVSGEQQEPSGGEFLQEESQESLTNTEQSAANSIFNSQGSIQNRVIKPREKQSQNSKGSTSPRSSATDISCKELEQIMDSTLAAKAYCEKLLNENYAHYLDVEYVRLIIFKKMTEIAEKIFKWKIMRAQARDSHFKIANLKNFFRNATTKESGPAIPNDRERREGRCFNTIAELKEEEKRRKAIKKAATGNELPNTSRRGTASALDKNWDAKDEKGPSHFATVVFTQDDTEGQGEEIRGDLLMTSNDENTNINDEVLTIDASMPLTNEKTVNNFITGNLTLTRNTSLKSLTESENSKDALEVPELKDLGRGRTVFEEDERELSNQLKYKFIPVSETDSVTAIANALNSSKYMKEVYIKEGFLESERFITEEFEESDPHAYKFFQQKMSNEQINEERDLLTIKFSMVESPEAKELGKNIKKPAPVVQQSPSNEKLTINVSNTPDSNTQLNDNDCVSPLLVTKKEEMKILIHFPIQFEALRMMNKVSLGSFIKSIALSSNWENTGGKSHASFIKSYDNFFIFKRLDKSEFKMFKTYALDFFKYLFRSQFHKKPSLLGKIYGCFEVHTQHYKHFYICMENLFYGFDKYPELLVYDLKGSETNRYVNRTKPGQVLLDTNFKINQNGEPLPLAAKDKQFCFKAFDKDSKFLADHNLIDYSLLLIIEPKIFQVRMGIIDYLRIYTWDKSLEHYGKKVMKGGMIPTIINPDGYRNRFKDAMSKYFMEIPID